MLYRISDPLSFLRLTSSQSAYPSSLCISHSVSLNVFGKIQSWIRILLKILLLSSGELPDDVKLFFFLFYSRPHIPMQKNSLNKLVPPLEIRGWGFRSLWQGVEAYAFLILCVCETPGRQGAMTETHFVRRRYVDLVQVRRYTAAVDHLLHFSLTS